MKDWPTTHASDDRDSSDDASWFWRLHRRMNDRSLRWAIHRYPALKDLPEDQAVRRLRLYSSVGWPRVLKVLGILVMILPLLAYSFQGFFQLLIFLVLPLQLAIAVVAWKAAERIEARVNARIKADLEAGRVLECIDCGYELSGADAEYCPECGADVTAMKVPPEATSDPVAPPRTRVRSGKLPPSQFEQWD